MFVTVWQQQLAGINQENEKLTKLANSLANEIDMYKSTRIKHDIADINSALELEQERLSDIENRFNEMKRDASVNPMTCYDAFNKIEWDFNQLQGYEYNNALAYAKNQFHAALDSLESRLSQVQPNIENTKRIAQEFSSEIKNSKNTLPKLKIKPGDEIPVIAEYEEIVNNARTQLPNFKEKETTILSKAKEYIQEGDELRKRTQRLVRCN